MAENPIIKRERGRPMKEIDLNEVARLAGLGLTREQIAALLNISLPTLYSRQKEDPAFAEAMKSGRAKSLEVVSSRLMELVAEGNLGAMIFYLKSQGGWSEKQSIELTGKNGGAIEVNNHGVESLSTEQLLEIARMNDSKTEDLK